MPQTGRMYQCARCREQVVVCRRCDRGQIYCLAGCATLARRERQRAAARRYQSSRRGRFVHAERSRRHRHRQRASTQIVTHQGSVALDAGDLLRFEATVAVNASIDAQLDVVADEVVQLSAPVESSPSCKQCGALCAAGVRYGFVRHLRRLCNPALADRSIGRAPHPFLDDHPP